MGTDEKMLEAVKRSSIRGQDNPFSPFLTHSLIFSFIWSVNTTGEGTLLGRYCANARGTI